MGIKYIKLNDIQENPFQQRSETEKGIEELAENIFEEYQKTSINSGLLQLPEASFDDATKKWVLSFGFRRLSAFKFLYNKYGETWGEMPVLEVSKLNKKDLWRRPVIENSQRVDISTLDKAKLMKRAKEQFNEMTLDEIGKTFGGLKKGSVKNLIDLLTLPSAIQDLIEQNELTQLHGRALVKAKKKGIDDVGLINLAEDCIKYGIGTSEFERKVNETIDYNNNNSDEYSDDITPSEQADPVQSFKPTEQVNPTVQTEPAQQVELVQSFEPTEQVYLPEPIQQTELAKQGEPSEHSSNVEIMITLTRSVYELLFSPENTEDIDSVVNKAIKMYFDNTSFQDEI